MNKGLTKDKVPTSISIKEQKLLELLHKIGFGRVVIFLEDGQPIRIEEGIKSSRL